MTFWVTTRTNPNVTAKAVLLTLAVIFLSIITAMPVLAKDMPNNIVVYDNREKILKITEISFTNDFTSMSVLVVNLQTRADFRIEHDLNIGDTFNEYIEITATDGMGNISETVHIKNPFYVPVVIEEPPIVGSLNVTGDSGNGNLISNESENINQSANENEPENETESAPDDEESVEQNNGFNTSGWASVVDNVATNSKEFFIVRSETGNEFYMIIDRENGRDNVYFLNAVTEWDLLGLTERYEVPNNLNPNSPLNNMGNTVNTPVYQEPQENNPPQNTQPTPETNQGTEAPIEPPKQGGIGIFGTIALILFAGAIGAYFYFFKIRKKPATQVSNDGEYLPDAYGDDGEDDDENDNGEQGNDEYEDEEYEDDEESNDYEKINEEENESEREAEPPKERTETETPPQNTERPPKDTADPPTPPKEPKGEAAPKPPPKNTADEPPPKDKPKDNPDKDDGGADEETNFTDDDVGDDDYGEYGEHDDYEGEIDESDVLGGSEGGDDEDEDNTV